MSIGTLSLSPKTVRLFAEFCFSFRSRISLRMVWSWLSYSICLFFLMVASFAISLIFSSSVLKADAVVEDLRTIKGLTRFQRGETCQFCSASKIFSNLPGSRSRLIVYSTSSCPSFWSSFPRSISRYMASIIKSSSSRTLGMSRIFSSSLYGRIYPEASI